MNYVVCCFVDKGGIVCPTTHLRVQIRKEDLIKWQIYWYIETVVWKAAYRFYDLLYDIITRGKIEFSPSMDKQLQSL